MSSEDLFDRSILPSEVIAALPEGYSMRPLRVTDYDSGFLDCLRVLTKVGEYSREAFEERYAFMKAQKDYYYIVVETEGRVVGTGAVLIEKKFIRELGSVGHIEDIAVARDQQGKKLGLRIINALDAIAKQAGCYKVFLDCSDTNEAFYVKCGFRRAGLQMAHYYAEDNAQAHV